MGFDPARAGESAEDGPEAVKMQALIQRCNTELEEMNLIEQYQKDEGYEPKLDLEHDA